MSFYFREFWELNHKWENKNSQNILPSFIDEKIGGENSENWKNK